MATWKKLIVSGSNVSQLVNDAGYLTSATVIIPNGFATASFNGVNLLADNLVDSLNFASSSGTGLEISADAETDTLTFSLSAVPNSSLENSTISGKALGTNLDNHSAGAGILGSAYNGSEAQTWSIDSGSMLPYYSSSIFAKVSGDITISAAGVAAIGTGVIVNTNINANAAIDYTKLNFAGSGFVSASTLSSAAQGEVVLTTNGVAGTTVDLGLQTSDSPQFAGLTLTGDAAINGGDITTTNTSATVFNTTATTVNAFGAATTLNLGAASGNTTVGNNLVVTGDLTVNGTTTAINTTNVLVEDKFILLASGSAAGTDGGLIVQDNVVGTGFAFGYDTSDDRWVFQDSLSGTATSFGTATAYATTTEYGLASAKPSDGTGPAYGGAAAGFGNMWVSTDTGEIWIYS